MTDKRPPSENSSEDSSQSSRASQSGRAVTRLLSLHHQVTPPARETLEPLIQYWSGLREGTDVPRRAQIDPRCIDRLLPNTFLLERIATAHARFRLAGSVLAGLMGMDVRGMPLSAMLTPAGRNALCTPLEQAFDEPAMLEMVLDAPGGAGKPQLGARLVLLPLRGETGAIDRALGALISSAARPGRVPRRFDIRTVALTNASQVPATPRPASPATPGPEPVTRFETSLAEVNAGARRAHLRLVHSV